MACPPTHPHTPAWSRRGPRLLAALLLLPLLALLPPAPAEAKKPPKPPEMEKVIRERELARLQREYKKNLSVEDELYQYEQAGRWKQFGTKTYTAKLGYNFYREYVNKNQTIIPMSNGDRYLTEAFWMDWETGKTAREQLPDWMQSEEYLEARAAKRDLNRVSPVPDAPDDEVRVVWGLDVLAKKRTWTGVSHLGFEKYDPRTQKWYPAYGRKDYSTGNKWVYDYTDIGRAVMMENIRRETIYRIGQKKYQQLMEHARTRTPEYKIEKVMQGVRARATRWDKSQQKWVPIYPDKQPSAPKFRAKAQASPKPTAKKQATLRVEAPPRARPTAKEREKKMAKKAEAQQKREAEAGPPQPGADTGAGIPVIPDTCIIDVVGWLVKYPKNKFHGTLWLSGGKVAWAVEMKSPAQQRKEVRFTARTCVTVFRGRLRDNVISGTSEENCTPMTTYWTNSNGPCSRTMKWHYTSRDRLTLHLDGSFGGVSTHTSHSQWATSNEKRCGNSDSRTTSQTLRLRGTWRIRRGGGSAGRSWTDKWATHRLYNPDVVQSD